MSKIRTFSHTLLAATVLAQPIAAEAADSQFWFRINKGTFGSYVPGGQTLAEAMLPMRTTVNGDPTATRDIFYDGESEGNPKSYQASDGDVIEIEFPYAVGASRSLVGVEALGASSNRRRASLFGFVSSAHADEPASIEASWQAPDGSWSIPVKATITSIGETRIEYGQLVTSARFRFKVAGGLVISDLRVGGAPANPRPVFADLSVLGDTSRQGGQRIRVATASKVYSAAEPTIEVVSGTLPPGARFEGGELVFDDTVKPVGGPWNMTLRATDGVGFTSEVVSKSIKSFDPKSGSVLTIRFDDPIKARRAVITLASGSAKVTATYLNLDGSQSKPIDETITGEGTHDLAYESADGEGVVSKVFRFAFDGDVEIDDVFVDGEPLDDVVFDPPKNVEIVTGDRLLPDVASAASVISDDAAVTRVAAITDGDVATALTVTPAANTVDLDFGKVVKATGATLVSHSGASAPYVISAFDGEAYTDVGWGDGQDKDGAVPFPAPVYARKFRLTFPELADGQTVDLRSLRIGSAVMPKPVVKVPSQAVAALLDGDAQSVRLATTQTWPYTNKAEGLKWTLSGGALPSGATIAQSGSLSIPAGPYDAETYAFQAKVANAYGLSSASDLKLAQSVQTAPDAKTKLPAVTVAGIVTASDAAVQKTAALHDADPLTAVTLSGSNQTAAADFGMAVTVSKVDMSFVVPSSTDWAVESLKSSGWTVLKSGTGPYDGTLSLDRPTIARQFRLRFAGPSAGSIKTLRFGSDPMPAPTFTRPEGDTLAALAGKPVTVTLPGKIDWPYDNVAGLLTYRKKSGDLPNAAAVKADGTIDLVDTTNGAQTWDFVAEASNPFGLAASRGFRIATAGIDAPSALRKLPKTVTGGTIDAVDPDLTKVAAMTDVDLATAVVLDPTEPAIVADFGETVKTSRIDISATASGPVDWEVAAFVEGAWKVVSLTKASASVSGSLDLDAPVIAQLFRLRAVGLAGLAPVTTLRFGSAPMPAIAFAQAQNAVVGKLDGKAKTVTLSAGYAWPYDNADGKVTYRLVSGPLPGAASVSASGLITLDGDARGKAEWPFKVAADNAYGLTSERDLRLVEEASTAPVDCAADPDASGCSPTEGTPSTGGGTGSGGTGTGNTGTGNTGSGGTGTGGTGGGTGTGGTGGCTVDCAPDPSVTPDPVDVGPVETGSDVNPDPLEPDQFQNPDGVYPAKAGETITISFPRYVRAAYSAVTLVEGATSVLASYKLPDGTWSSPVQTPVATGETRVPYGSTVTSTSWRFKFVDAVKLSSIRIGVQKTTLRPRMLFDNNATIADAASAANSEVQLVGFSEAVDASNPPNVILIPVSGSLPAGTYFDGGKVVFSSDVNPSGGPWIFKVIAVVNGYESPAYQYVIDATAPSSENNLPAASGGETSNGGSVEGAVTDEDQGTYVTLSDANPVVTLEFDRYVASSNADVSVDFSQPRTWIVEAYEQGQWSLLSTRTDQSFSGRVEFGRNVITRKVRLRLAQ